MKLVIRNTEKFAATMKRANKMVGSVELRPYKCSDGVNEGKYGVEVFNTWYKGNIQYFHPTDVEFIEEEKVVSVT
jgi:hypothetical protein